MTGICPEILEVRSRDRVDAWLCDQPDGHELPHRSMYLRPRVELAASADSREQTLRHETTAVEIVWT